jgi:hypothetical protein
LETIYCDERGALDGERFDFLYRHAASATNGHMNKSAFKMGSIEARFNIGRQSRPMRLGMPSSSPSHPVIWKCGICGRISINRPWCLMAGICHAKTASISKIRAKAGSLGSGGDMPGRVLPSVLCYFLDPTPSSLERLGDKRNVRR